MPKIQITEEDANAYSRAVSKITKEAEREIRAGMRKLLMALPDKNVKVDMYVEGDATRRGKTHRIKLHIDITVHSPED